MTLGDITTLREKLGGKRKGKLVIGITYARAVKIGAGFGGRRWFDVDAAADWLSKHPEWKSTSVYPGGKRRNGQRPPRRKRSIAGKSRE